MRIASLLLVSLLSYPFAVDACCAVRRASTVTAFRKAHPCPSTGKIQKSCPGFIIDHRVPIACDGGRDAVDNMQYQTVEDAKAKDKIERKTCVPCTP
jgi:hypothetical protein